MITRFADRPDHTSRSTYQALITIFSQQCELRDQAVVVKTRTGGDCVQNPSDLDATYSGHKGAGYQVQLTETCVPENEVQLLTAALPQTACEPDGNAVVPMLDQLDQAGRLPAEMLADTLYTGDENVQAAEARGVDLIGPVPGRVPESDPAALTVDDFAFDERSGTIHACPAGHQPTSCARDAATATTRIEMPASACSECPFRPQCPIEKTRDGKYTVEIGDKSRRLAGRRVEESTHGIPGAIRAAVGDRVDQQRLEESSGPWPLASARTRECVPSDRSQSRRLERAASGRLEDVARLGQERSGPDPQRERIWADLGALYPRSAALGRPPEESRVF